MYLVGVSQNIYGMLLKFVGAPDTPTLNIIFNVYTGYPLQSS